MLVAYDGPDEAAARAAAMQIAAMRPQYVSSRRSPCRHRRQRTPHRRGHGSRGGQTGCGTPKIVEGRVNGFFKQVTLLEQPSVQDNKKSVQQVLTTPESLSVVSRASRSARLRDVAVTPEPGALEAPQPAVPPPGSYGRVLLKLSGEAFAGYWWAWRRP